MDSKSKYRVEEEDRKALAGYRKHAKFNGKGRCSSCRFRVRGPNHEAGAHHQGNRTGKLASKRGW